MSELAIQMLLPEQVSDYWTGLEPLLEAACEAHEIAQGEMTAADIRRLAEDGECALFVMSRDTELAAVMAIQFYQTNGHKGADVIAFAGTHMMAFKNAYWQGILDWLCMNGVEYVDAYLPESRVKLYKKKFGFTQSCAQVRLDLRGRMSNEQIS